MDEKDMELFQEFLAFKQFKEARIEPNKKVRTNKRQKYKQRSDGFYQTSVTIGIDDETGKPIKEYVYAKTITELESRKACLLVEKGKGVRLDKQNITVKQYRIGWLETKKVKLGKNGINTIKMYESIFRNYFSEIDDLAIKDVTSDILQSVINQNADKKRQCQKIKMTYNELFESIINDRLLTFNPAKGLSVPNYKAPEKRNLTDDEDILSEISDFTDRQRAFIYLIKYFGLRKEEALAVEKKDFDFKSKTLSINKAVIFDSNQPIIKDTKNTCPRTLPIMPNVFGFLKYYISNLETESLFVNLTNNTYMTEQGYKNLWQTIKNKMIKKGEELHKHIEQDLSAHIFRHNYAYMLMYADIDMKERQYLLGHKTISMTMDIYTHIETNKMRAPKRLEEFAKDNLMRLDK